MGVTAADYLWIGEWGGGLFLNAYCLTFVRGITPESLLDRLDVTERTPLHGAQQTVEPSAAAWDVHGGRGSYVAATRAGEWALVFESNGWLGTVMDVIVPLSRGTSLVSHYRNVNALDIFTWVEHGDLQLVFEPLFPSQRRGSRADAVAAVMQEVGFDLREGDDRTYERHTEAAFALAERLTGVSVSPQLLDGSDFLCGIAPLPA